MKIEAAAQTPAGPSATHDDGGERWPLERRAAWTRLLRTHAQLVRPLEQALLAEHGLTLSAYELLACLAAEPHGLLRISHLAQRTQLSQPRVSRLVDELVTRGLVERQPCPVDSRVVHVALTDAGRALVERAHRTQMRDLDERFFGRLSCEEVRALERILAKAELDGGAA